MKLKAENINMSFDKKRVLNNVSFEIESGKITALIGRNGSGKTTILKILSRILDAQSGETWIDDKNLLENPSLKENIAYLPDRFDYFNYEKGKAAIYYYETIYPDFDGNFLIDEAKKLDLSLETPIRNLSKGNKTILGLLIILATNAKIILVDEVLDGLDILNRETISRYLLDAAENGRAILVSSHQISELKGLSDKVLYLSMDGHLKEQQEDSGYSKFQIVTKEFLPKDIEEKVIVTSKLGRVYTVLFAGDKSLFKNYLNREEIVQYDELLVQLEDLFYLENKEVQKNEKL